MRTFPAVRTAAALLMSLGAVMYLAGASYAAGISDKPKVAILRSEARAWDPQVQQRVVDDMADGQPSKALQIPRLQRFPLPKYPAAARKAGVQGEVNLVARVGKTGKVEEVTEVKGDPHLAEAVRAAVMSWRYSPMKLDGEPRELKILIDVSFSLE